MSGFDFLLNYIFIGVLTTFVLFMLFSKNKNNPKIKAIMKEKDFNNFFYILWLYWLPYVIALYIFDKMTKR